MAFADYFGKNLQAASYLLQGIDPDAFKEVLSKESIGIAFDRAAVASPEGQRTLDVLIRLLARLYPVLSPVSLDREAKKKISALQKLARAVNPKIDLNVSSNDLTRCLVVGNSTVRGVGKHCKVLYVGSENWFALLSTKKPAGCGSSGNPFGAGAAACLAVANIFRQSFADHLSNPKQDENAIFSVLEMQTVKKGARNPAWAVVPLEEVFLVGCGAIGNGFIWAMRELANKGTLHVLDDDVLDVTNLQRYMLTVPGDEGVHKTELARRWLSSTALELKAHSECWETFVSNGTNWHFDRVAVAVDTKEARIRIQSSLPRVVHNSWTQRGEAGVSRHGFVGEEACMACLYMPGEAALNYDQLVQKALKLPDQLLMEVRRRLDLRLTNERPFLELMASFGIPLEQLLPFEGKTLEDLYQKGACGGAVLALRDGDVARRIEVPMSFQSALAGILLAADVYAEVGRLRERLPTRTQINLLTALPEFSPSDRVLKPAVNRCLCADVDFLDAYEAKYPRAQPHAATKRSEPVRRRNIR